MDTYDDVVKRVANQLGLGDPSKLRLTSHNCYSQQPKPHTIVFLSWNQIGVKSKKSKAGRQYFSCCLWFWQTIGQAYEDMQTQNQRLLQQVTERDEYNIKVWKGDFWDFVFEICGIFYYRVQCMPAESKEAGIV